MPDSFDLVALIRAVAIGLGVALVGRFIIYWIVERGHEGHEEERERKKKYFLIALIGTSFFIAVVLFNLWPNLVVVPSLDQLSKAEAENLLHSNKLIPQFTEAYAPGIDIGRVIVGSQQPSSGLRVKRGETVTFAVAAEPVISILLPETNGKAVCSQDADKIYRFTVSGRFNATDFSVLFWVQPANDNWYLQRLPINIDSQGFFSGTAQIGNKEWPPHEGDVINVAVTLAEKQVASQLMSQMGEVVAAQPVGLKSDRAFNVVVTLKK